MQTGGTAGLVVPPVSALGYATGMWIVEAAAPGVTPWFLSAEVLAALLALIGVLITQAIIAKKQRADHQLAALQATVTLLSDRVTKLEESLARAEARAEQLEDQEREAEKALWHAITYLREVISWARMVTPMVPGDEKPTIPPVPDTISEYL